MSSIKGAMYIAIRCHVFVIFSLNYSCIMMKNNGKSHWTPKKIMSLRAQKTTIYTVQVLEAHYPE